MKYKSSEIHWSYVSYIVYEWIKFLKYITFLLYDTYVKNSCATTVTVHKYPLTNMFLYCHLHKCPLCQEGLKIPNIYSKALKRKTIAKRTEQKDKHGRICYRKPYIEGQTIQDEPTIGGEFMYYQLV